MLRFKNYPDELILYRVGGGYSRALGVGVVVQIQPFLNHKQHDSETGKDWLCRAHCLGEMQETRDGLVGRFTILAWPLPDP